MTSLSIPAVAVLKTRAQALRQTLAEAGEAISHSQSLERLAQTMGHRNWNTLHALAGNGPAELVLQINGRVSGRYLGKPFEGTVLGIQFLPHAKSQRVTIKFDEPVDVVEFEGWSNFRQRVTSNITENGKTVQKTSNGRPIMELDL